MQGGCSYRPGITMITRPQYPGMGYCDVLRAADGTVLHAWLVHDKLVAPATASGVGVGVGAAPRRFADPPARQRGQAVRTRLGGGGGLLGMIRALGPFAGCTSLLLDYRGYGAVAITSQTNVGYGKMLRRRSNGRTGRCAMGGLVAVCLCWGAARRRPLQCARTGAADATDARRMGGLRERVASAQMSDC